MHTANLDPVAAANAAVNAAQQTLNTLIEQRDAVTAREQQLAAERGKIAFAAHGDGNSKAKSRLSAIHRELAETGSELASYDAAIDEAKSRNAAAQEAARREVEKQKAREALDYLDQLLSHAHGAERELQSYLKEIEGFERVAERICAIAGHPSRDHVRIGIQRGYQSGFSASRYRAVLEIPLLPPNQRLPLTGWAEQWAENIRHRLAQRLAEPEAEQAA